MSERLHIFLADDDADDRFFFNMALSKLPIPTKLTVAEDGEKLMHHLLQNADNLPAILFLDMNMPRKNGAECLQEIRQHKLLKELPVIIYSTSLQNDVADKLYSDGAYYYIRKTGVKELEGTLLYILTLIREHKFVRPAKDKFIFRPGTS